MVAGCGVMCEWFKKRKKFVFKALQEERGGTVDS